MNGRKRSFEESRDDHGDPNENGDHSRKRSRECTPEEAKKTESVKDKDGISGSLSQNVSATEPQEPEVATPLDTAQKNSDSESTLPENLLDLEDYEYYEALESLARAVAAKSRELEKSKESEKSKDQNVKSDPGSAVSLKGISTEGPGISSNKHNHDEDEDDTNTHSQDLSVPSDFDQASNAANGSAAQNVSDPESVSESETSGLATSPETAEHLDKSSLPSSEAGASITPRKKNRRKKLLNPFEDEENLIFKIEAIFTPSGSEEEYSASEDGQDVNSDTGDLPSPKDQSAEEPDSDNKKNDYTNTQSQDTEQSSIEPSSAPPPKQSDAMDDESAKVPKKKRSREQLEDESSKKSEALGEAAQEPIQTEPSDETSAAKGEPEKKRHRDNSQEPDTKTDNGFATSAFGKAAAASPFAAFAKPAASTEESTQKTTQPSAFASSSLSAFAGSETSPFSALGSSTSSVFKPAGAGSSGFASASGTSGFGALGSGFAGVGGGFGAAGKAGGLSSFASSNAPATLGESKPKAIGAEESDEEGSDNDEEETSTFEAEKTDERFYEQTIETGEEQESTIFTCKAKLFHFSNKEWKERGIGTFKVNVRENASGKTTGRMIMRADGALRVMLNSPIFKGMNYGDAHNNAPESKQILLASMEDGKTVPLLLRTGNEAYAKELYEVIGDLLEKA
ncbi:uncharacterized protein N7459_009123 [Penicillium hispanicum]|uniref:uncharacterized protein n=1 Tax=Penicillium hispanicum TaxID=1080232 RepID=UPI0025401002|nr:uncharacterized protein N7459_009123 [Penicillium hispanicum]KAJ5569693.1 hypothetical protein N7459_009123 [Penicillium hispanicum]